MARTLTDKIAGLPAARRERIAARANELIAEEMSLQALRKARNQTQVAIARKMKVGQDTVSRYEQRTDMLLSTLRHYIQAAGGNLSLVAEFPDRAPVKIEGLGEITEQTARRA